MINDKFGLLQPLENAGKDKYKRPLWLCLCECGNEVIVSQNNLRTGNTKSCGCKKNTSKLINDLTGLRFSKLVVLKRNPCMDHKTFWLCQCDCGNQCIVWSPNLKRNHTKSCGCLVKETSSDTAKKKLRPVTGYFVQIVNGVQN